MNYPDQDNLVPLTELAVDLGFTPKKKDFDPDRYIPIKLIPVKKLLLIQNFKDFLMEI